MRKRKKLELIKVPKTFEQYMDWRIQKGYIDNDLNPLKCEKCGCRKFKEDNYDYLEHYVCEYDVICKCCGSIEGHWAYGYNQL